ncbi:MAG: carboxypeptidase regulatory-like domain-containing protein [Planctomycetota bacterium]|nr:carboxypeptidase regulatory-like domain-containing protein [Planctomycetota bacterium]
MSADGFAKTLSPEFEVGADTGRIEVDVVLSTGGTLRGRVLDENGKPLAGALVETQPDGAPPDNPVWRMLASAAPQKITALRVTTADDGGFVLPLLAEADYQLQVEHADACRAFVPGLAVGRGERELEPIRLPAGSIVFGRATVGGKVKGQIKVVLATVVAQDAPRQTAAAAIRLETVTDSAGAWQMPRRVPPGQYELRATVVGDANPDTQILSQMLQLQRSSTTLSVPAGQRQVEHHIDLPTEH